MATQRRLGLIINHADPLGTEMLRGVADRLAEGGDWLYIATSQMPAVQTLEMFEALLRAHPAKVDGVIAQVYGDDMLARLRRHTNVIVNVSNRFEHVDTPRVAPDDVAIGRLAAAHFLERGFTTLAFAGFDEHWYSQRRLQGFRDALQEAGVQALETFVDIAEVSPSPEVLSEHIAAWVRQLPRPLGIFACNDVRGRHMLAGVEHAGLNVPDEVAVLGVDFDEWMRIRMHVPLSSIDPAPRRVGYEAASLMIRMMDGERPPAEPVFIPPVGVITRRSTDAIAVDDPIVVQASQYIRENAERELVVEDVVEAVGCSRRSLEMRFRKHLGRSPQEAIWRAHVDRARHLLEHTSLPAKAIAQRCGFGNAERLSVVFRRYTGLSPTGYRKQRTR